jgi:PAS domain S-box-containing protein
MPELHTLVGVGALALGLLGLLVLALALPPGAPTLGDDEVLEADITALALSLAETRAGGQADTVADTAHGVAVDPDVDALARRVHQRIVELGGPGRAEADRLQAALAQGGRAETVEALRALDRALHGALHAPRAAGVALRLEEQRQLVIWLAAGALLAAGLLGAAALAMRRQRLVLRSAVRRASDELGTGAWQGALRTLSDDRLGAPSAFDALACGVEEALGASERRWQTLADLAADWYWETDTGHRLAWMSGTGPLAALPGLRAPDLLGKRHDEIDAFDAPGEGWARLHAVLEARRAFRDMEFRVRLGAGDDEALWLAISGRPRHDAQGEFAGYEGVGRDVSERKRAHERLRASDQRWALMAGLASDYYWETDSEHRILPLRPEVARRFGVMAEHSEGRTPWEAFPDAMSPAQWDEYRADVAERRPYRGVEMAIDLADGRQRIVSTSGVPRFDGEGRFLGYHGIGRDITLRREAERLLLRHNEALQRAVAERTAELERVNRDLEAFARELAHELRTPIGQVQGLAHLLVSKAGDRLAAEDLELVELQLGAARHMRETVDGLLTLARSSTETLSVQPVDLSALAVEVVAQLPPLPRQSPVDWRIDPGLTACATPSALRIVLANLLGNAAKFTRHRQRPWVRLSGSLDADGRLRLRVEDNGAGFDMAMSERLFKPFARLHSDEEFHGTGIGLTIVQRIVERHGGRVAAHGVPGQGAWFEITLPTASG